MLRELNAVLYLDQRQTSCVSGTHLLISLECYPFSFSNISASVGFIVDPLCVVLR